MFVGLHSSIQIHLYAECLAAYINKKSINRINSIHTGKHTQANTHMIFVIYAMCNWARVMREQREPTKPHHSHRTDINSPSSNKAYQK